ncbi:MAG: hypothetical protein WCF30_19730 [Terracidiphilus sp.]
MADEPNAPATASSGLSEDAASGLAYLTPIPAIIFLIVAPYNTNPKIKFHAWQNIFLAIGWFACSVVAIIPILGWIVGFLGILVLFVCWLIAIIQAFQGKRFVIPVIGPLAAKQAGV